MTTLHPDYIPAILEAYSLPPGLGVEERDSGMNNTTRYVLLPDEEVRVLRIYENHRSTEKLAVEHELLRLLAEQELPFAIPCPLRTREGGTWTIAPDGKLAALFTYLSGAKPTPEQHHLAYAYGLATGQLTQAMEGLRLQAAPAYPPYDELLGGHTAEAAESARRLYHADPALASLAGEANFLLDIWVSLSSRAESIRHLERQWIHGDFSHANVLMDGGAVSAVLDFEFATHDLRAMELAVVLAEQLSAPGGLSRRVVLDMLAGYRQASQLTTDEWACLPELLQLRKLDVLLHFLNRYEAGLDPVAILVDQTRKSAAVCQFISTEADWIRSV
ncbi:phosphotransferase [Paenibacillus sanguinis]|uniref:phosphotransferase n=1 Tax=Paenibacillus sanguinis TaxID=225906 RepID=UPI00037F6D30|nr:phosphotransferase [Paenibacillus sanguinis]